MTNGWKDRGAGLIVFGSLQILLGLAAVCVLFGAAAAAELQSRGGGPALPAAGLIANILLYAVAAFYFFAVGVGSIRKRRWARALSLVVSAMWLAVGVVTIGIVAILLPRLMTLFPPSSGISFAVFVFACLGVTCIIVPLALVLFYRSPHVRATCDARDPVPRWTDRVPLPILALVLMMAFAAVSVIGSAAYGIAPLFGVMLTGAPAVVVLVAVAGLCAFLAVQLYRLKRSAWWTLVLLDVIGAANGAVTLATVDFTKLYEQLGVMTPQIRAMHLTDVHRDPMLWVFMAVCWTALFAYLVWTRRFFDAPPPRTRAGDAVVA